MEGLQPLVQRNLGPLHNCPHGDAKVLAATLLGAAIDAGALGLIGAVNDATVRANRAIGPKDAFQHRAGGFVVLKVRFGKQAVLGHDHCSDGPITTPCGLWCQPDNPHLSRPSATLDCIRGAEWFNAFPPSPLRGSRPAPSTCRSRPDCRPLPLHYVNDKTADRLPRYTRPVGVASAPIEPHLESLPRGASYDSSGAKSLRCSSVLLRDELRHVPAAQAMPKFQGPFQGPFPPPPRSRTTPRHLAVLCKCSGYRDMSRCDGRQLECHPPVSRPSFVRATCAVISFIRSCC